MTVKELREKAKQMGLKGYSRLRKAELERFIEENTLHNSEVIFIGECSGNGEWLNHRRIGATDTAVLVVDNAYRNKLLDRPDKYTSPYLMWAERKGIYQKDISFDSQVAMDFGHYAEDFIIEHLPPLFKKEFNIDVEATRKGNQVVVNKEYPLWSCTPDSWVKINGEWYPVELKTGNSYTKYEWETEKVPDKYFAQVQQQLAVLGKERGFIVGFVDNRFTKVYEVQKEETLIKTAYELTKQFQNCLDNNIEPELNGCEAECEFLKIEFKGFKNKYMSMPTADIKNADEYITFKSVKSEITKDIKEAENRMNLIASQVQKRMLELETETLIVNDKYLATWKIDSRGAKRFNIKEIKNMKEVA